MDLRRRRPSSTPQEASWDDASINHAIEDAFLTIRAGKQAKIELGREDLPLRGAVVTFPVAVFAPGLNVKKSLRPYPLSMTIEPGTVLPPGTHKIEAKGTVKEEKLVGYFFVVVGGSPTAPIPAAAWEVRKNGRGQNPADDIQDLPQSFRVAADTKAKIKRDLRQITRLMEHAYADLYHLSMPTMRAALQKYQSALFHQSSSLDLGDILQECWLRHLQRVDTYASPERPNATWRQVLVVNTRRDGGRELRRNPHKISDQVAQLVGLIRNNPELRSPEDVQRHVTVAREVAKREKENPGQLRQSIVQDVEKDWEKGKLQPRVSIRVAENAFLAAPFESTVSLSAPVSNHVDMSQDDFIADPDLSTEGGNAFEMEEQLREVTEIITMLFPDSAYDFLSALGIEGTGTSSGTKAVTMGDARRQIIRKLRSKNNDPALEEVRSRVARILLDDSGDLRSTAELRELIDIGKGTKRA
jgi:DNA-directed RNA polymerase specialized sigma24 family protein